MSKNCILRLFLYIIPILVFSGRIWGHSPHKAKPIASHHYFVENKGQWAEDVLFRAEIRQGNVLVTKEGITYQMISHELSQSAEGLSAGGVKSVHGGSKKIKGQIINITFENGNDNWVVSKKHRAKANFQFLKGNDSQNWVQEAQAWSQIELKGVYDGIDLKLYFENGSLKYDFIVSPNTDPNQIRLKYEGANSLQIEDGSLAIYTCLGKIYERPPYSYQITQKGTKEIKSKFVVNQNIVHFELSNFNRSLPLIIDPKLIFSTYSGSRDDNWGNTATYDDAGNLYSGGIVFGDSAYPVTPGPFDMYSGGDIDVFILKYSPDGTNLLFAAYLGGAESEIPISMIVNKQNQLVVLGITSSPDFPVTQNAFDTTFNGGTWSDAFFNLDGTFLSNYSPIVELKNGTDIFVSILNTTSNSMIASTYLGGNQNDGFIRGLNPLVKNYGDQLRGEVMIDSTDNIYIVSHSLSDSIANYQNVAERNHGGLDAIVAKFTPTLSNLDWLKFVGGTGSESGFGIRIDSLNTVYITGGTTSNNLFPVGTLGFQDIYNGGIDGYVAKLSGDGTTLLAGTFLGTFSYDQCYFIDLDFNLDVYVVGQTTGPYPVSPDVYANPNSGQFIHILSNDLLTSKLSTVFGSGSGRPDISLTAFMVNNCRKIFVSGWGGQTNGPIQSFEHPKGSKNYLSFNMRYIGGSTQNLPTTSDAVKKTSNGSSFYFFIFHPDTKNLAYATHYGGENDNFEHVDGGTSRFDKRGIIYQSACASCGNSEIDFPNNFPTTPNAWSNTNNSSNCNNAALKFDLGKVVADFESFDSLTAIPSKYGCVPITFRIKNNSSGATNYKWEVGNGAISFKDDSIFIKFTQRGFQKITLIAFDTSICRLVDTARSTVNAGDVKVDFVPDIKQCGLSPVVPNIQLYTPWAKVKWEPTEGLSNPNIANPVLSYTGKDMVYHISVTDDTLCMKFDTLSAKIRDPNPKTKLKVWNRDRTKEQYSFCYPNDGFLTAQSTTHDYVEWKEDGNQFNVGVDSSFHVFPYPGKIKYEVLVYDSICNRNATDTRMVTLSQPLPKYPIDTTLCPNTPITSKVLADSGSSYLWLPEILFSNPTLNTQTFLPKENRKIGIIVTDSIGCVDSSGYNISILEFTDAIVDKELKFCRRKSDGIEIYANQLNIYQWEPSGYTGNPLKVTTTSSHFLTGLDMNNCPVKDTVKVTERCDPELYVPNAFSPNGDGQNDFFEVFGYDVSAFDIKIFDRWGEIIYHSTDFKFNWDGKYQSQTVPIGTYPFVISYKGTTFEGEPVSKTFSGDVTVVR